MRKIKFVPLLLALGLLASCGNVESTTTSITTINESQINQLSSTNYELEKEYFYQDYNERSLADTQRQGIKTFESKDNIVFDAITYEQLVNMLESNGNYLILFWGSWCHNTRAAINYINDFANEYNIEKIYNFDFYMDGSNSNTHIRNTNQSDLSKVTPGVEYNYLYGELVSRYLTNLNDFVEYKEGNSSSLTYTNSLNLDVNVSKLQVPFLFLYNKDNRDNVTNEKKPILYGFEEMVDRDNVGVYTTYRENGESKRRYITEEYKNRLKYIFDYIKDSNIELNQYNDDNYIIDTYNKKSGKTIFESTDKINIKNITYRQLIFLLNQEGKSLIYFGGTWCPNTQATIKETNKLANENNLIVYNFDTKLDSGYAKKYWSYSKDLHIRDTQNPFVKLYTNLIEQYLTNIETIYDVNASESYKYISYINDSGEEIKVKKLQVPFFFAYDKDNLDSDSFNAPILKSYEEMLTLNEEDQSFAYSNSNYESLRNNTLEVINTYLNH